MHENKLLNHYRNNMWENEALKTVTNLKKILANLSIVVRTDQFSIFKKLCIPTKNTRILDVGVTSDETLKDSNIFERLYNYPSNIVAATVENPIKFKKIYPNIKVIKISPNKKLPFKDKSFDIVTAWAVIEHVGNYKKQEFFLKELIRVGKKVFLTTPYRGCIYEPHSNTFFLHWLPLKLFRSLLNIIGRSFWSVDEHLNPLYVKDVDKFKKPINSSIKVFIYCMYKVIPSHLIIYN